MKNGSQKKTDAIDNIAERPDLRAQIEARAYHLWRQGGGRHGDDLNHWLQAERELTNRSRDSRTTG